MTIVHEELKVHTGRDWPPDNVTIATNGGRASCTMTNIKDNKVSLYWEAPALPCASVLQITIGPVSHFLRRPLYFIFFFGYLEFGSTLVFPQMSWAGQLNEMIDNTMGPHNIIFNVNGTCFYRPVSSLFHRQKWTEPEICINGPYAILYLIHASGTMHYELFNGPYDIRKYCIKLHNNNKKIQRTNS